MEKSDKETVSLNLRSVIQSCKGGVPVNRLDRDYYALLGEHIPFKKLGFYDLKGFLRSIPNVIHLKQDNHGEIIADAVADASTAHIASLVNRQKQSKPNVPRLPRRTSYNPYKTRGYTSRGSRGSRGGRGSYSSYSSRSTQSSGSSFKYDANFQVRRPRTPPTPPGRDSPSPPPKPKSSFPGPQRPVTVRGYEVAPRFLRLTQRKIEFENARASSVTEDTSPVSSSEQPRYDRNSDNGWTDTKSFTDNSCAAAFSPEPAEVPVHNHTARPLSYSNNGGHVVRSPVREPEDAPYNHVPRPLLSRNNHDHLDRSKRLESAESAKDYVQIYANINNIPFNYSTSRIGQKRNLGFVSNLKIEGKTFLLYPNMRSTAEEAEEAVAEIAVEYLKQKKVHLATLPETAVNNVKDIQTFLLRIEELVCEKPTGMFINGIRKEYENKYSESIPEGWIDIVKQSSVVEVEEIEVTCGKIPAGMNIIVRPVMGQSSGSTTPSETSIRGFGELQDSENDECVSKTNFFPLLSVPELIVPAGNEWSIYITNTTNIISARLIDLDDEFLSMLNKMIEFYSDYSLPLEEEVQEKQLYVALSNGPDGTLIVDRVLVNKFLNEDEVQCYYVDEGHFADLKVIELQNVCDGCLDVPYQAIHLALDDFEGFNSAIKKEDLSSLLNKSYIAVVKRWCDRWYDDSSLLDDSAVHRLMYSVVLYDTSDTDEDVCVNNSLKRRVLKSHECMLPPIGVASRGYLTSVTSDGSIYLRLTDPENSWLEEMMEKLSESFQDACTMVNISLECNKMYAAKFEEKWYRALYENSTPTNSSKVEVFFIDYGYYSLVEKCQICELQPHSEFLCSLSKQTIVCKLDISPDLQWTPQASERLWELVPLHAELILRVGTVESTDDVAKVHLHKRVETSLGDSVILSINDTLMEKPGLFLSNAVNSTATSSKVPTSLGLYSKTSQRPLKNSFTDFISSPTSEKSEAIRTEQNFRIVSPTNDVLERVITPDAFKSPEEPEDEQPLDLPVVPDSGEFDVFVTMAASPHNFVVQPLKSAVEMRELMNQMNIFYSNEENLIEMHPSLLKENNYYAALHSDNNWYRIRLVSVSFSDPIMVTAYYVDYGDFNISLSLQNMQKLWNRFRTLPCQAIKASLAGVRPLERDWTPEQSIRFRELVEERRFVSHIRRQEVRDPLGCPYIHLDLCLIDTNQPETDIYIDRLLVSERLALADH